VAAAVVEQMVVLLALPETAKQMVELVGLVVGPQQGLVVRAELALRYLHQELMAAEREVAEVLLRAFKAGRMQPIERSMQIHRVAALHGVRGVAVVAGVIPMSLTLVLAVLVVLVEDLAAVAFTAVQVVPA
jgi:hypothetical protein